jgi:roadblock/LC7 domain-containing protein
LRPFDDAFATGHFRGEGGIVEYGENHEDEELRMMVDISIANSVN